MKHIRIIFLIGIFLNLSLPTHVQSKVTITTLAEGLFNPVGLALLPDGGVLIAEEGTGERDTSAGVSLLTADGELGRLISGFPSGRDSGDLSGVALVGVSPDGETLYIGHFNSQQLYTLPTQDAQSLPDAPFSADDMGTAMERLNNVFLLNPFDMTFDADGIPVVSDASGNGVAKEQSGGTTRFIHRFNELNYPNDDRLSIDPVPTGITHIDGEYYVTLFGGCPYPPNSGELVAIDEERNQRIVVDNLSMPIDVEVDADGIIWILEFGSFDDEGSCFSGTGYQPETGRLSRLLDDGTLEIVVDGLDFPGAVLPMPDGSLLVSEIFAGRILQIQFEETQATTPTERTVISNPNQRSQAAHLWRFEDVAEAAGLDFQHGAFTQSLEQDHIAEMGAGLCWIDYDADGWLDLYLVNSHALHEIDYWETNGGLPTNALYRNVNGQFVDVSTTTGTDLAMRGNGCVAADFNNDGWNDIYITADEANALLYNNGDATFTEGAAQAGVAATEWNSAIAVADLNADGWLDMFVGGYIDLDNPVPNPIGAFPQDYGGIPDRLYMNDGADDSGRVTFTEVTDKAGLLFSERTLGAVFTDVDNDNDLDLYIANDGEPNRLYIYEAADTEIGFQFIDSYNTSDVNDRGSGMGVASADWTGDGWTDLIVTNWDKELNAIYRNQTESTGYPNFEYATYRVGLQGMGNSMTGWGVHFADFDLDTDLDLLTVNGRVPMTNLETDAEWVRLYTNQMAEGNPDQFLDWTSLVGLRQLGGLMARGSAAADYDYDGDLDVAINQIGRQVVLLENALPDGNWIMVDIVNGQPGTRVTVTLPDGRVLQRETQIGSSYLASEDPRVHFGLGEFMVATAIHIQYPTGEQITLSNIAANQQVTIGD